MNAPLVGVDQSAHKEITALSAPPDCGFWHVPRDPLQFLVTNEMVSDSHRSQRTIVRANATAPPCTPVGFDYPEIYRVVRVVRLVFEKTDWRENWLLRVFQLSAEATTSASVPVAEAATNFLMAELQELRGLQAGWDGEAAAASNSAAVDDAISFVLAAAVDLTALMEPTLHVDGSVLLEIGDGSEGSLRFKGDHTIIHAIRGFTPGIAGFDGITVPKEISAVLLGRKAPQK